MEGVERIIMKELVPFKKRPERACFLSLKQGRLQERAAVCKPGRGFARTSPYWHPDLKLSSLCTCEKLMSVVKAT